MDKLAIIIVLLALWPLTTAYACDTEGASAPESTCVKTSFRGLEGTWFPQTTADELQQYSLEVPQLRLKIKNLELREEIAGKDIGSLDRELASLRLSASQAVKLANRTAQELQRARAESDRWYQSPFIWLATGVVMGLSAGALVVLYVHD